MFRFFNLIDQWRTAKIALPMMVAQFVYGLAFFSNTFIAAKFGHLALAAMGLGIGVAAISAWVMIGFSSSITVLVARAYGAGRDEEIAQVIQQGWVGTLLISLLSFSMLWFSPYFFSAVGQDPKVIAILTPLVHVWALLQVSLAIEVCIVDFLLGLSKTHLVMLMSLTEIPINIFFKFSFAFGDWGLPKLGLKGIVFASLIGCFLSIFGYSLYLVFNKQLRAYRLWHWRQQSWHHLIEMFRIGWPVTISNLSEMGFFMMMAVMMGKISNDFLAANQIVMQYLSLLTMLIFGACQATIARVGQAIGANDAVATVRTAASGFYVVSYIAIIVAISFVLLENYLIGFDINIHLAKNAHLFVLAQHLFVLAAVFILFDSFRLTMTCVLRAYKATHFIMLVNVFCFWGIALGGGSLFAFVFNWGANGVWLALIMATIIGGLSLYGRFYYQSKHFANLLGNGKRGSQTR